MATFDESTFIKVTDAEWVQFLADYDVHGTEPDAHTLAHKHTDTDEVLAFVKQTTPKEYYIKVNPTTPKDF